MRPAPAGRERAPASEQALARFHEEQDLGEEILGRAYDLRLLLRLWPFVRPHARYVYGSTALLLLIAAVGLVRPLVMRAALDAFAAPGAAAALARYGLALALLLAVEQILAFPQMYWVEIAGAAAMADLRRQLFAHLHRLPLAFFDRTPLGRLVSRATSDVDAVGEMFSAGTLNAAGDLARLVAIVAIMLWLDWRASLFAFALLPPVAFGVEQARRRIRRAYREVRARTARMNAFLNEQVAGIAVVQAFAPERPSEREFARQNAAYREANLRGILLEATLDASIEMVSSLCIASLLWYAGVARAFGAGFGTLFAFVAYIEMFFLPVRSLAARYTQIQSALAGAERIFELLAVSEVDAPVAGPRGSDEPPHPSAAVEDEGVGFALERVSFAYQPGTPVLREVSLRVRRGSTVALVGPTGSGKSTVAALLLRLYEAHEGRIEIFGRDVRALGRDALSRLFTVVPQDVFLFAGTIAGNVAAGEPEPDRARVEEILARLGAQGLVARREGGIDAAVLERGSNFSAGERQLIAFARALYRDPPILILDEPTSNVDSDTEARLLQAMPALTAGRTTLVIAHRLSSVRFADRIVCLHRGRVVEQGTHDELLAAGGMYARLWRWQQAQDRVEAAVEAQAD
ncbi:MAG: ABC transporter ATP-binding protein [Deltaproteobacteria bacterium]|nr:ABC transporter ATP-binding protein [Deltaproteobacteria bacterium]